MALELPSEAVVALYYIGLPWPGIDEDQLRAWARSVRSFAGQVTNISAQTQSTISELADSSESSFTSALAARWEHHDQLIVGLHGPLYDFAEALDVAADAVVVQKGAVIAALVAFAAELVATEVGAVVTGGLDEIALPVEFLSTRKLVQAALNILEGVLIGKLAGTAVQAISDHISRFLGSLLGDALPVVAEGVSLKISYGILSDAAKTVGGHAAETERAGDAAYSENASRDLEDSGEGGQWPAVAAVKQALYDLAGDLFKTLPGAIARAQEDTVSALTKMTREFEEEDSAAGDAVPQITAPGEPGRLQAGSAAGEGGALPTGAGRSETDLAAAGEAKGASDPLVGRPFGADPVDLATGDVILAEADVTLPGVLPLTVERAHRSSWRAGRWFGRSWLSSLDQRLLVTSERAVGAFADGRVLSWAHPAEPGLAPVLPETGPAWPLQRNPDGSYTVVDPQRGLTWRFEHWAGYQAGPGDQGELPLVSLSDRAGHEIAFSYDAAGQPVSVSHSGGYRVRVTVTDGRVTGLVLAGRDGSAAVTLARYEYDADGNLAGVVNSSGQPLRFGYDTAGRLTGWTDRIGQYYRYSYDTQGRCVRGEGPDDAMSGTFAYEPGITRWTDVSGAVTIHEITPSAYLAATTDPLGNVTRWERDARGRVTTLIDPLGRVTRYAHDVEGNLIAVTRPDGSQVTAEYDEQSQPVLVTGPDESEWRPEYDARGNRTRLVAPDGTVTELGYDDRGHLTRITAPDGGVTIVVCDLAGLPAEVIGPDGAEVQYERDPLGRITRITAPDGGITSLAWTTEGRPTSRTFADGATETWSWDPEGNLVRHVSATGAQTSYEYGPFNKVTGMRWADGTRSQFRYDHELRLTEVTHAGLTWRYDHDPAGRLVAETDYNGATTTYSHDKAGQLIRRVNAAGQETTLGYDTLGNLIQSAADGTVTTFGYDQAGRLMNARNADAEVKLDRDALGRVVAETCDGRTVRSEYDAAGRVIRRVTPSGTVTTWEYDPAGQPVAMTANGQRLGFGYDQAGRETRRELPGGLTLTQGWDLRGRLTLQALTGSGGPLPEGPSPAVPGQVLQRRAYSYRPDGLVDSIDDLLAGHRAIGLDRTGRVTAVTGEDWDERYSYDRAGNVSAASWPVPPSSPAAPWLDAGAQGQREVTGTLVTRAGNIRYRHDRQGRVTQRQKTRISRRPDTWHYEWDAGNRLTSVTTPDGSIWRYRYDPFGRRVAKQHLAPDGSITEQTEFTWDGALLAEQARTVAAADQREVIAWNYQPGSFTPLTQAEHTSLRDAPQEPGRRALLRDHHGLDRYPFGAHQLRWHPGRSPGPDPLGRHHVGLRRRPDAAPLPRPVRRPGNRPALQQPALLQPSQRQLPDP